jgi:hypothetical protein
MASLHILHPLQLRLFNMRMCNEADAVRAHPSHLYSKRNPPMQIEGKGKSLVI